MKPTHVGALPRAPAAVPGCRSPLHAPARPRAVAARAPGGIGLGRDGVRAPDTAARAAPRPPPLPAAPRAVYTDSDVNK